MLTRSVVTKETNEPCYDFAPGGCGMSEEEKEVSFWPGHKTHLYLKNFIFVTRPGACQSRSTLGSLEMTAIVAGAILNHLRRLLMFFSKF